MLVELNIANFAIIDQLNLQFAPGFNALTGETGAGKSIIIDAVTMLLGGRADTTLTRTGTDRARVEGVFQLTKPLQAIINPILEREGLEGEAPEYIVLGRELRSTGRNFCRVNGSTVSLSVLKEVSQPLVDIHGQHDNLSLMQVRHHLRLLDRFAGLEKQQEELAVEVQRLYQVRANLAELLRDEQHLAQRMDQLTFQVDEIQAADLSPGEEAELNQERTRLANAEQLNKLAGEAHRLLVESSDEQPSTVDMLGQAARLIANLVKLDESLNEQQQQINDLSYQLEDLAETLRDYTDSVEFDPVRLQDVEERLTLIFNLKRKYGDSVAEVIAFGERAATELNDISHSEERIESLRAEEEELRHKIGQMALEISRIRKIAAGTLAEGVVNQLSDLGMEKADFKVDMKWENDPAGVYVDGDTDEMRSVSFDERGIDQVEFLIATNPGEPFKPLVKVASGGEASRLMLGLKTVLALADETPTLIFDEIDQGIGGRVGSVVGRKLLGLSDKANHQVLCITHLPQIAGYADLHYHVRKHVEGNRTQTLVEQLQNEARVDELAQMLGNLSESTRQSAREILEEASAHQEKNGSTPETAQGVLL